MIDKGRIGWQTNWKKEWAKRKLLSPLCHVTTLKWRITTVASPDRYHFMILLANVGPTSILLRPPLYYTSLSDSMFSLDHFFLLLAWPPCPPWSLSFSTLLKMFQSSSLMVSKR